MALFDKVKAQAAQVARLAEDADKAGQARIGEAQAHKRAEGLVRELGIAVLASRTGRGTPRRRVNRTITSSGG